MPAGAQVFSPTGGTVFSTPDRLNQFVGSMRLPASDTSGSIINSLFTRGTPYFYVKANYFYRVKWRVTVTFVGDTLNWQVQSVVNLEGDYKTYGILMYGVR